jgi:type II secretory pathway pseudopilin PulG
MKKSLEPILIIAAALILTLLVVYALGVRARNPKPSGAIQSLQKLQSAMEEYRLAHGSYPDISPSTDAAQLGIKFPELLNGLPDGFDFVDPWGQPYQYKKLSQDSCSIHSKGPDKLDGAEEYDADNIISR